MIRNQYTYIQVLGVQGVPTNNVAAETVCDPRVVIQVPDVMAGFLAFYPKTSEQSYFPCRPSFRVSQLLWPMYYLSLTPSAHFQLHPCS